jgi:formamidopyrimidine-DNA glycosylase
MARGTVGRRVLRSDLRVPRHATADLAGATVTAFDSYGKHLLTRFDCGLTLHTHLQMDGSWSLLRPGKRLPPRLDPDVRVELALDDGTRAVGLLLPVVELLATRDEHLVLGHLGPDVLADDFDPERAAPRLLADPARPLVQALLDQRGVAGLGNLWAVETCFLRGVSPWTPVGDVDVAALLRLAQRMMRYSLGVAGQVTTGDRRPGFAHWVYGRAGEPCRRCRTPVCFKAAAAAPYQRETWWCPRCQPGPAPAPDPGRPRAGNGSSGRRGTSARR